MIPTRPILSEFAPRRKGIRKMNNLLLFQGYIMKVSERYIYI